MFKKKNYIKNWKNFRNSKKLFITDFKVKKKHKPKKEEEESFDKEDDFDDNLILQVENTWSYKKPFDKDFIEHNKKTVIPLRYQFACDALPENKKKRLDQLMQEIETDYINNEAVLKKEQEFVNPFGIDEQGLEKIKELDEKLQNFHSKKEESKQEEEIPLEKINDALYVEEN